MGVIEELRERGFIEQCSNVKELESLFKKKPVAYYAGFDPTADSLHIGSLIPIMAMTHLQKAGHYPIAVIGGGTAMIGDPSGKTEMRRLLSEEIVTENSHGILSQLRQFLFLDGESGMFVNNARWLRDLNYIDFLRDIGQYFKVNEMIKMEAYRQRLEREEGLSFIEFNYQLLQAYDFLMLFQQEGCVLQLGGNDQWGNILAGIDLVRRVTGKRIHGLTFPLLTTAGGKKMGKTERGTVWLDGQKTSPYEYYQYWINTDDRDVERFLAYFTFLPRNEISTLVQEADVLQAKEVLAFETTKLLHGEEAAKGAQEQSRALFSKKGLGLVGLKNMPTTMVRESELKIMRITDLLVKTGLAKTISEAARMVKHGGVYVNGERFTNMEPGYIKGEMLDNQLLLRRGKKNHHRVIIQPPE